MNRYFITGNWKLNPTTQEQAINLVKEYVQANIQCTLCIPSIYIGSVLPLVQDSNVQIGSQNCSEHEAGAFTGETSAKQLHDLNIKYTIIGHSERRALFGETNSTIGKKLQTAQTNSLTPILCIGENQQQRDNDLTDAVITQQLIECLEGININNNLVIAYEPVWAIGTGKVCSAEEGNRVCKLIREFIEKKYTREVAHNLIIQYGGSVTSASASDILGQEHINGVLVGGASLKPQEFISICNIQNI